MATRFPTRLLAVTAGLAVAAGLAATAAGAPGPKTDKVKLRSMVLTARDVPEGFAVASTRFYSPSQLAVIGSWKLSQLKSWGYVVGYEAEFTQGVEPQDAAQLSSDAGAYRTPNGARRSLAANADACAKTPWIELPLDQKIGDAAHLCTRLVILRGYVAQVFFVVWQKGRFKGAITLSAIQDRFTAADAIALAKKQSNRMT